jgi:hypothetical protein
MGKNHCKNKTGHIIKTKEAIQPHGRKPYQMKSPSMGK